MIELINILAVGVTDDDGEVLENGSVAFYDAGTTNPLTAYQDFELTEPHPNPATLDEAGRLIAYIDGKFKMIISDSSGNIIRTIDNLGTDDSEITIAVGGSTLAGSGLEVEEDGQLAVSVDGTTIEVGATGLQVKDDSIDTIHLKDAVVTRAKQAALTAQVSSSSSGAFTTTSTSYTDITNMSVSITTTGRPVLIMVHGNGSGSEDGYFGILYAGESAYGHIKLVRASTDVVVVSFGTEVTGASNVSFRIPGSSFSYIDQPGAGTYTYKLQAKVSTDTSRTFSASQLKLVAVEL